MGQAVAAVALVAALGAGLWMAEETSSSHSAPHPPATCSGGEPEKAEGDTGKVPRYVSGAQLCKALNRLDLAELLGTPGEIAKTAGGSGGSFKPAGGKEVATPSARVEFGTYTVTLAATHWPWGQATGVGSTCANRASDDASESGNGRRTSHTAPVTEPATPSRPAGFRAAAPLRRG